MSSSSSSPPRVAVIGGGMTGTLCSLALQHRGVIPTVIEQGRRFGGRLSSPGAHWLRASTLPLAALYESLCRQGLLWSNNNNHNNKNERFGVLGSAGGGFLPQTQIPQPRLHENRTNNNNKSVAAMMDSGDFCHFIEGSAAPTFGGNLETLCGKLLEHSQIDAVTHTTVLGATAAPDGWHLDMQTNTHDGHHHASEITTTSAQFDGLVIATHNASLAANIVQGIAESELAAGTASTAPVLQKLQRLTKDLHAVRQSKIPVFTLQFMLDNNNNNNNNNDDAIPFDAVTVPGSRLIQFLSRRDKIWTAVSTSQFAKDLLSQSNNSGNDNDDYNDHNDQVLLNQQAEQALTAEVQRLLAPFVTTTTTTTTSTTLFTMTHATVKCWPAAFSGQALLCAQDDCIVLQPWRLTIAGDYIIRRCRDDDNDATTTITTPLEAAATSGLAAGEQTASYFAHTNGWSPPPPQ